MYAHNNNNNTHAGGQGNAPGSAAASLVGGGEVGGIGGGGNYGMDASMIGPQAMGGMGQPVRLVGPTMHTHLS